MRIMIIIVAALALLYGGYWFVGSRAVESGARDAITTLRQEGWQVDYTDLTTRGFPSRFDTTVTDLDLRDPGTGIGWQAPFLQIFALSYRPNQVIAVWPDTQTIILPDQTLTVTSDRLRASAAVRPGADMALDTVTVEAGATRVASDADWHVAVGRALMALREAGTAAGEYDLFFEASDITLPDGFFDAENPTGSVTPMTPAAVSPAVLRLDSRLGLDRRLDRFAGSRQGPHLQSLSLRDLRLIWGESSISGTGELTFDRNGVPEGEIRFTLHGWRDIIALVAASGLIDPNLAPTWENVAQALSAEDESLELPLSFQNGYMSFGPMPLGPAPRFR